MPGFEFLALGGLLTGLVFGLWNHVKAFAWKMASCVVVQVNLDPESSRRLLRQAWAGDFHVGRFRDLHYVSFFSFSAKVGLTRRFACEVLEGGRTYWLWKGWRLVLLERTSEVTVRITTLRTFFDVEKEFVVSTALIANAEVVNRMFSISRASGSRGKPFGLTPHGKGDVFGRLSPPTDSSSPTTSGSYGSNSLTVAEMRPIGVSRQELQDDGSHKLVLDDLALTAEQTAARTRCERWAQMQAWYAERTVPWRLGLLLHGKPGTGKTSFAKGIAQKLKCSLYVVDLATYGNAEFAEAWDAICCRDGPVAILLEDIDAVFDKRKNLTWTDTDPGLSFDCLLNVIAGVQDRQGVLLLVTTNDVTKIDEALLRPGRLDVRVEFPVPTYEARLKICRRILRDWPELIEKTAEATDGMTGAAVQERCESIALEKVWEKQTELDAMLTAACAAIARRPKSELIPQA